MRKDHRVRQKAVKLESGDYSKSYRETGKRYLTKEYSFWHNLYDRVNCKARHAADPKYIGCTLGFDSYNSFAEWCSNQIGFDEEGWVLDKDILCHMKSKEKIYSPETCVFVPVSINAFLTFRSNKNTTGYSGVSAIKSQGYSANFMACCTNLNGKNTTLGRTYTAEEAYLLYRKHKVNLAKQLVDKYKGRVDEKVITYLDNFDEYIDDLAIFNKGEK